MKTSNVIVTTLGALAVGAIAGVLFAPEKGSKTRKKIARKAEDLSDDFKESIEDLTTTISEKYDVVKEKSAELIKNGTEKATVLKEELIASQN